MGQKVNPIGLRVGVIRDWDSKWYADKEYADFLNEDIKIRDFLAKELKDAAVSRVEIERFKDKIDLFVHTAKPGVVIGKGGEGIEALKNKLVRNFKGKKIQINVVEVKNPDTDAQLLAFSIAEQLENRASFRTVQKRAIQRAMRAGAKGVKTLVSGRLGGADMARSEGYSEGNVPLHTLRANIDYATAEAMTTYGLLGIKVWIYKGEILGKRKVEIERDTRRDNRKENRRPKGEESK
ncbi:small subunit ribosomal protein S3 [Bacilli bacterium PM5-3]|nr:small subunit ribosomal protein S3 [Bacilli bacterium PM5-3]MDH6604190.1 small subunit ribosomal protein S3 [Bacilli bacterium PM5-9]